jgi:hypothetical protein
MSQLTDSEEENLYQMLQSEQIESIQAGLALAQSQGTDISVFLSEIQQLCGWLECTDSTEAAQQLLKVNTTTEINFHRKELTVVAQSIKHLVRLENWICVKTNWILYPNPSGNSQISLIWIWVKIN